jgi:hypothetical protein
MYFLAITLLNILFLVLNITLRNSNEVVETNSSLRRSKRVLARPWKQADISFAKVPKVSSSFSQLSPRKRGVLLNVLIPDGADKVFQYGLTEVIKRYPETFLPVTSDGEDKQYAFNVKLNHISCLEQNGCSNKNSVASRISDDNSITVSYSSYSGAFRALGRLMVAARNAPFVRQSLLSGIISGFVFQDVPRFLELGVKIDMSSGGVMKVESLKNTMISLALYGYNTLFLHMEDAFEVPSEPFVGYLRGKYSEFELREIGKAARSLGIEIVPAIQALNDLDHILSWPSYVTYKDSRGNLKMGYDNSYILLERVFLAVTEPLQSKRIHIGLESMKGVRNIGKCCVDDDDETNNLNDTIILKVFAMHLQRLLDVVHSLNLRPIMYTDLLFQLAKVGDCKCRNDKSFSNADLLGKVRNLLGENAIDLMFSEFSSSDVGQYKELIDLHEKLKNTRPVLDSFLTLSLGLWTWNRFWAALHWTMSTLYAGVDAASSKGVQSVVVEARVNDGNQLDFISAEAGIAYFAELVRLQQSKSKLMILQQVEESFSSIFRSISTFSDILQACSIDQVPGVPIGWGITNTANWLLWEDPLLSHLSNTIREKELIKHYRELANSLDLKIRSDVKSSRMSDEMREADIALHPLAFPAAISRVLYRKSLLKMHFRKAYEKADKKILSEIISKKRNGIFFQLIDSVFSLRQIHKLVWQQRYKQTGWEILEGRYGIVRARLEGFGGMLQEYVDGDIPELEWTGENMKLEVYNVENFLLPLIDWSKAVFPSFQASSCFDESK